MSSVVKCSSCNIVICELLAFVQNKVDIMDEEGIIRLCTTAFSYEDIVHAKKLFFDSVSTACRKASRKKEGRLQRDLEDIICFIKKTDPEVMPIFVAKDLQKLPPVTFDHIDATRLLKDIIILQNEISFIKEKYATIEMVKQGIPNLAVFSNYSRQKGGCLLDSCFNVDSGPIGMTHTTEEALTANDNVTERGNSVPAMLMSNNAIPLALSPERQHDVVSPVNDEQRVEAGTVVSDNSCGRAINASVHASTKSDISRVGGNCNNDICETSIERSSERKQMADVVRNGGKWKLEPHKEEWILMQRKRLKNRFVGKKGKADINPDCGFKAADINIPFYIYNVDKNASIDDIDKYIKTKTNVQVSLERVNMKQNKEYTAYKFLIPKQKLSVFMDENLWPSGVSFRRFYTFNKSRNHNGSDKEKEVINKNKK